jgi:EmrB/QacA subfamily drug resistance transporter
LFKRPGRAGPYLQYMYQNSCARPALTLAAVAVVQFMVSLDLSVVNVGLPQIAAALGFSAVGLTWVIHAYALTFGGLLLLGGKAADRYGRKRVLLLGLGLFGLASLVGGFATEPGHLIAARAAQGIGAAALAPAALALLTATFPTGRARVKAFGVWSATNAAGGAFGVLIGGLLTEYASWRWVMFVSVPMAACALAMTWRGVLAGPPPVRSGRPDVLGAVLATAGMTLLVFGVVRTDQYPWTSPVTLTTLAVAAALLAAFIVVEQTTTREPLIRLGLFANRSVTGANIYNLLVGAAMASAFYFMSLYLQRVLGTGPALTGIQFLPFAFGVIAGAVLAIKLGYRFAPRTLLVFGGLLTAAGFAWFSMISPDGAFTTDVMGPSIVASVGFGLCLGPLVSIATIGVAAHEAGTASGLLNSTRQIGASLGLAALGTAAQHRTGPMATPETLSEGYALGLSLSAALLVAAALIALTVLRRAGTPAPVEPARPPDAITFPRSAKGPSTPMSAEEALGARVRSKRTGAMKIRLVVFGSATALSVSACGAPTVAAPSGSGIVPPAGASASTSVDPAALQSTLDGVHHAGIPGVFADVRDADQIWRGASGVADVGTGRPVSPDMRQRVGSVTKTFTAAAILQQVEKGRIQLDAPIGGYLPQLVPGERGAKITVRMLLNHTSGIPDYLQYAFPSLQGTPSPTSLDDNRFRQFSSVELIEMGMTAPPTVPPGAPTGVYSNTNYLLLGQLLDQVSGTTAEEYITRNVIERAGLEHTEFPAGPNIEEPHPRMYEALHGLIDPPRDYSDYDMSWVRTGAALVSTMDDLNRFYEALLAGEIVDRSSLAEMQRTVPVLGPGLGGQMIDYGLGLHKVSMPDCGTFWGHDGTVWGAQTMSLTRADGTRQMSVAMNLVRWNQLDSSGTPQHHPIDDALLAFYRQAMCGNGTR